MSARSRPALSLPLFFTVVVWGFNFVALKLLFPKMPASVLGLARWFVMLAGLYALCALMRIAPRVSRRDLSAVLLQGLLSLGVYMILFLEGTARTGAAESAIILATAPVFTALFSALVGQEKLSPAILTWGTVAFAGVAIVILGAGGSLQGELVGDLLVLGSSVVWAFAAVLSQPLLSKVHPLSMLTVSMYGALPVLLIYGASPTLKLDWLGLGAQSWMLFLYVALVAGVLGFAGFYQGVRQISAPGAMLYQYFVSPLAALFSWLILGDALTPVQLLGMLVVILGVAMSTKARKAVELRNLAPGPCSGGK